MPKEEKLVKHWVGNPQVSAKVSVYADMVKVSANTHNEAVAGGRREACVGFSEASRRRMIQKMAMLNLNGKYCIFCTLTYPSVYSSDWHIWKRDLDVFQKTLGRQYSFIIGDCWKEEFQGRGAPHYHLILISDESLCSCTPTSYTNKRNGQKKTKHSTTCKIRAFRSEIAVLWPNIVRDSYLQQCQDKALREAYSDVYSKHLKAGTNVEQVVSRKQLMAYVAKYMAKTDGNDNMPAEWGRTWGFRNLNGEMDFSPVEELNISWDESVQLKRLVRRWLKSRGKNRYSRMLGRMPSYSLLGLGADSENGRLIYKLLGGIRRGLFAPHNSPALRESQTTSPLASKMIDIHKQAAEVYRLKKAVPSLKRGDLVMTPDGHGTVSVVMWCDVLKDWRVSVVVNGVWSAFDARQVAVLAQYKMAMQASS